MKLNNLISVSGKNSKRVGRGIGSGKGKTSTRGTKGQNSRAGGGVRLGFEGGQMPLVQRIPKLKGFKKVIEKFQIVNFNDLKDLGVKITKEDLQKNKIILDKNKPVKILSDGEIKKAITIEADAISKAALAKLEKQGGKFIKKSEK